MVKVTAVVVTYNRVNLLQRVVKALESQTIGLYKILVVNNGSTDGTKEWLDSQTNLTVIHQDNVVVLAVSIVESMRHRKKKQTGFGVWTTMFFREKTVSKSCWMSHANMTIWELFAHIA